MSAAGPDRPTALSAWQVLKIPDYRAIWLADLVSGIGSGATGLAMLLMLTDWSDDPGIIAVFTIASTVPMILVGPFAGVLVDRWNRMTIVVVGRLIQAVLVLSLMFMTPDLLWLTALVIAAQFSVTTFTAPAASAIFGLVIPNHGRAGASGLGGATGFVVGTIGAGIASTMYATDMLDTVFVLDAVTFIAAALLYLRIRRNPAVGKRPAAATRPAFKKDLAEGMVFLSRNSALRYLLFGFASISIATAAINVLYVPLAVDHLHADGFGIFAVQATAGLGTVMVGLLAGHLSRVLSDLAWFRIGILAFALLGIGYGLSPNLWYLVALHFLFNCVGVRLSASIETLFLAITPNHQLGRVGSAVNAVERGLYVALNAGVAALTGLIEIRTVLIIYGVVAAIVAAVAGSLLTSARLTKAAVLDDEEAQPKPATSEAA